MLADIQFHLALGQFLREDSTVGAMVAASEAGRPAVEAIGAALLRQFGDSVQPNPVKQRIGRIVRRIMESEGFEPHKRRQAAKCVLFTAGTVYRPAPPSIAAVLDHYGIDLPDDVIQREVLDATAHVVGDPPFVSATRRLDWTLMTATAPDHKLGPPLRAFVTAVNHELWQQDCRRNAALPDNQLTVEDRQRLGLDNLNVEQPHRSLPRVRTALRAGALCATGFTLGETAQLLDSDQSTVSAWVRRRRLYRTPIAQSALVRLPLFQFDADGLVPKVEAVLPLLDAAIHPVGVFNWFTRPNPDLALQQTFFEPTSPRDWLLRHYPSKAVCRLAAAVPVGIAA